MQLNFHSVDALGCHELCPVSGVAFSPIFNAAPHTQNEQD